MLSKPLTRQPSIANRRTIEPSGSGAADHRAMEPSSRQAGEPSRRQPLNHQAVGRQAVGQLSQQAIEPLNRRAAKLVSRCVVNWQESRQAIEP